MTERVCPECNGQGLVDQGTEDEGRCPTCNGSGVVPDDGQGSEEVWNTGAVLIPSPSVLI
jgi:DnaJ-class molecular chaperone